MSDKMTNAVDKESSEDEAFEDAFEDLLSSSTNMSLEEAIEHSSGSLNLFMNNRYEEAKLRMEPWSTRTVYHALGFGTIMYLQAAMTLEAADIDTAITITRRSTDVCHRQRRHVGLGATLVKPAQGRHHFYRNFSDEQCHAELCYAECLLERAFLTFVQDENVMGMVKGGLKIRECYKSYRECWKMLHFRTWKSDYLKEQFDCGTRMGVGAFNLMLSLLPPKILKLLEFVGFSGNKQFGLEQLQIASRQQRSIRAPLCALILLGYHTFVAHMLGLGEGNIEKARDILKPCLEKYPQGALFLFFRGRINLIDGAIDKAIIFYEKSVDSQAEWRQFHHICYWELMWCYCFKGDWLFAMKYAEILSKESRWSKATYLYQKGCFMFMLDEQTKETEQHLRAIFEQVPKLTQRFAGKSIPIEKFAMRKSERFIKQQGRLTLPALELIYVWNGFVVIGHNPPLLDQILLLVESATRYILENQDLYVNYHDDYCLCLILKGVALKYRGQLFQAKMCFEEVMQNLKNIKQDLYLLPWCEMELALLAFAQQDLDGARQHLNQAKEFKGYALESRLHFRMHALSQRLNVSQISSCGAADAAAEGKAASAELTADFDDIPVDFGELKIE